ncbi:MAG: peptidase M17 [Bacteroidetes bacterium HGW-Bacteroidetes-17]|nr:MAG: peptidase M17 [Bacteroidetes bacterium HGW-Bacteroidetes-17]
MIKVKCAKKYGINSNLVILISDLKQLPKDLLDKNEIAFVKKSVEQEIKSVEFNKMSYWLFIQMIDQKNDLNRTSENARKSGDKLLEVINTHKLTGISVLDYTKNEILALPFAEGMSLGNYQFLKYFKEKTKKQNVLSEIKIISNIIDPKSVEQLNILTEANAIARTLVNEPVSYLTAEKFSEEIQQIFNETDVKVEVLNKRKIESLKMGGLLAVNKGSIDPPTFNIIEYKPENVVNQKPYVFVGKGVVYDTGGMNIKTEDHMNDMKCDMAGGAAVTGAIYAIAKAKLPVYVIGLIPATDNRTDGNAYVSGDVIYMHDGTSVEVLNTDAEGRIILADALSYAKKYEPELVIDLATLTGAAQRAIGHNGSVAMGTKSENEIKLLSESGYRVHERIVEFPFWEEYDEEIKSSIADIKNLGGPTAGAITAGKFLAHFTDYPYIHLDIAGTAFLNKKDSYRGLGGTGVGVRLLFDFIKHKMK